MLLALLVICALSTQLLGIPTAQALTERGETGAGVAVVEGSPEAEGAAEVEGAGAEGAAAGVEDAGAPATEATLSPEPQTPHIELTRAPSKTATVPLALLYVPDLSWDELAELAELGPTRLLDEAALGNLSCPSAWPASTLLADEDIGVYQLSGSGPGSFSAAITSIEDFASSELSPNTILIIVTAAPFGGGAPESELTPVIIRGGELRGYLTSDVTHRRGLITAGDFLALRDHLNHPPVEAGYSEASIDGIATKDTTAKRIDRLWNERVTIDSMLATKAAANFAFLVLVFATFALSILLLILGRHEKRTSRGALIPAIRILWLIVLAFPSATFLMFCVLPDRPSPTILVAALVIWIAVISLAALLIGWRTKWVNSLIALFGLVIVVIVAGQLVEGPLSMAGYLTYDITEGSRYYGMGNEQGALLFGSWITLSGLLINRYPGARAMPAFKRWGYPLASLALLFVATSPWLGASFGPLVWGFLGCFSSWWLFCGRRLRWWIVVLVLAGALGLALAVLYADIALNPASHMSQVIAPMSEGPLVLIFSIARDVWTYSLSLMREYVPAVIIVFLVFVFILLVILRVLQPGSYREFWQRNTAFRATYSVCFVLAAITFILEDSGAFTPAVLLIFPIACFVWLICDLHSWHMRILAAHAGRSGVPITLREMQQRALDLLSREGEEGARATDAEGDPDSRPAGRHFREKSGPQAVSTAAPAGSASAAVAAAAAASPATTTPATAAPAATSTAPAPAATATAAPADPQPSLGR
ncbi:MAG: hypothetical protein LBH64_01410, partial [Coriobacteriales bacterium]|nr:hypothetical protein [Coriobacteriales bacterium]